MIKRVLPHEIEDDDSFPYDFKNWDYPIELLRSSLYSVWWTEIDEDGNETALLMDYDGFVQWYSGRVDEWLKNDDSINWKDYPAEEYLPYHLGRTIYPVKVVSK